MGLFNLVIGTPGVRLCNPQPAERSSAMDGDHPETGSNANVRHRTVTSAVPTAGFGRERRFANVGFAAAISGAATTDIGRSATLDPGPTYDGRFPDPGPPRLAACRPVRGLAARR
jgi:hypothetical protein